MKLKNGQKNLKEKIWGSKQSIKNIVEFNNKSRPRTKEDMEKKRYLWKYIWSLWR